MRPLWKDFVLSVFLGLILPGILLNGAVLLLHQDWAVEVVPAPTEAATLPREPEIPVKLRLSENETVEMELEDYLVEVVLAEMPASFEMEALKAQAVAARTYTRKTMESGGKHGDGSLCADYQCCQAYLSIEDFRNLGGTEEALAKIQQAVMDTAGLCLTYEGALIEATYFSCSGGSTEDAVAVWGMDYPYLQAVPSPGEERAANFFDTLEFTPEAFQEALGVPLDGTPESWFGVAEYTDGGGVATLYIGGKPYSGVSLRAKLGLRSTAFQVEGQEDRVIFTTQGHGHRVGLSQYGADAMAVAGKNFREILEYYYTGAKVVEYP